MAIIEFKRSSSWDQRGQSVQEPSSHTEILTTTKQSAAEPLGERSLGGVAATTGEVGLSQIRRYLRDHGTAPVLEVVEEYTKLRASEREPTEGSMIIRVDDDFFNNGNQYFPEDSERHISERWLDLHIGDAHLTIHKSANPYRTEYLSLDAPLYTPLQARVVQSSLTPTLTLQQGDVAQMTLKERVNELDKADQSRALHLEANEAGFVIENKSPFSTHITYEVCIEGDWVPQEVDLAPGDTSTVYAYASGESDSVQLRNIVVEQEILSQPHVHLCSSNIELTLDQSHYRMEQTGHIVATVTPENFEAKLSEARRYNPDKNMVDLRIENLRDTRCLAAVQAYLDEHNMTLNRVDLPALHQSYVPEVLAAFPKGMIFIDGRCTRMQ